MIGEIPQGVKPEEAQHMPAESESFPEAPSYSTQYLETESSTNRPFSLISLFMKISILTINIAWKLRVNGFLGAFMKQALGLFHRISKVMLPQLLERGLSFIPPSLIQCCFSLAF